MASEGSVQSPRSATTSGCCNAACTSSLCNTLYLLTLQVMHQSAVTSMNTRLCCASASSIACSLSGCQFTLSLALACPASPKCGSSNVASQIAEPSIMTPRRRRKIFIQRPGRGKRSARPGRRATSSHGKLIPRPSAINSPHNVGSEAVNATATAVPRNGALHGVASRVANAPCQKCPDKPLPP